MGLPLDPDATDTERAVVGVGSTAELREILDAYARRVLGSPIADVLLRAGRIDVVWGVRLADGRDLAVKIHRQPADLDVLAAVRSAKETLAASGFPSPAPIAGPDVLDGHVITAETLLLDGRTPDGSDPRDHDLLVGGLVDHIALLRSRTDLLYRVGPGPAWCRYHDGPWPVPHDPIVDFTHPVPEYAWVDDLGRRAAEQVLAHRGDERVLGHADWYAGNVTVADGAIAGTFDWELIAEADAVIAGLSAPFLGDSPDGGGAVASPGGVAGFLRDYADRRGRAFTADEWRAAAGAATWVLAFNARWQVALLQQGLGERHLIDLLCRDGDAYLALGG